SEEDDVEPTVYLIEEDFLETEQIIKSNFKKIFKNELNMITENVEDHPEIKEATFHEWFHVIAGTTVIDNQSSDLKRFDLDYSNSISTIILLFFEPIVWLVVQHYEFKLSSL
ncbi:MAG TPA: hypothetical protein VKZ44_08210, partial [Taishania sp.]|nr:hypothetical protein [Taishania sp.]